MSNFLVVRRPKRRYSGGLCSILVCVSASNGSEAKRKALEYGEEMQPAHEYNKSLDVYPIEDGKILYL